MDVVLEFLKRNRFTKAEAALRGELGSRPEAGARSSEEKEVAGSGSRKQSGGTWSGEGSQEFIVKEIEIGGIRNGSNNQKAFVLGSDLYPWSSSTGMKDTDSIANSLSELAISDKRSEPELRSRDVGGSSAAEVEMKPSINKMKSFKTSSGFSKDEPPVKTVFPFSSVGASSSSYGDDTERKQKEEHGDVRENTEKKSIGNFGLPLIVENHREDLPRLPPVRLKSQEKLVSMNWEENSDRHGSGTKLSGDGCPFPLMGSFLDVPLGQEINSSGGKRPVGNSWLSVSQGITEDASDLVSGFATLGDDSVDYPNEYWDSDEYDDDEDVGYTRQPIEDETWFLAHEVDYPSDNDKGTGHGSVPDPHDRAPRKDEDDDQSFAEEDSYLSGEHYPQGKNIEQIAATDGPMGLAESQMYGRSDENDLIAQYDGQLMDVEELSLMRAVPVWQGFVSQSNELGMLQNGRVLNEGDRPHPDNLIMDDDQHGSVRSIGVGINSDAADIGSEIRESLIGGSSEGDIEYFNDHYDGIGGSRHTNTGYSIKSRKAKAKKSKQIPDKYILGSEKGVCPPAMSYTSGGFSFAAPLRSGDIQANSGISLWSSKVDAAVGDDSDNCGNDLSAEDMLATWRRTSSDSSLVKSSRDEKNSDVIRSRDSTASSASNGAYTEREDIKKEDDDRANDAREEDPGTTLEDEEAAALQEQVRQIKAQEEEFETFNLKIVHRKNRTGFEEDKNFHVVLNSVIAGRYHVTEYLGSAAFSKAIQAHDLHTGMDVCVKIIKNNKDFFDQSLDEIKLLKFVNKHDPGDKYHLLRLYDYFYYREHLLIVCELLKANLYEFHKFNRESGGEVYFTMPRLQSITIQCLEALQFLHGLGLIHCDLKPENILVKSYSRCEVKVIDLGSSCFETDHLCSYVQSRSYRAPEVILGLPYDKKIDIWSLGCILAELCTGNVLFQNDSPATLLARVLGIVGPIDQGMLTKGRDAYKYFTKNHMLYERNQETNRLEYLIPKKSSLRHRLPMGDQGFIDFVTHLLEVNPKKRPSASEALKHPWLSFPYEPISS